MMNIDPKKTIWEQALDVIEGDDDIQQEHESLDEMYDEEVKGNDYVEGIDNWEDWN